MNSKGHRSERRWSKRKKAKRTSREKDPNQQDLFFGNLQPTIPPGEYTAECYDVESGTGQNGKISYYLKFRLHDVDYQGVELFMVCPKPIGKVRPRHKLYNQWVIANARKPSEGESFTMESFKDKLYQVKVRFTKKRHPGANTIMPDSIQYSVVDSLLAQIRG